MTKRNDLDFLLMQPRGVEAERQAARREAFQQMAQTLQNKPLNNTNQVLGEPKNLNKASKSKSAAC
jgi:hypothetical protein